MVMEQAERRIAAEISGISNLTYDLVAALKAKLDEIAAYEIYRLDAHEAGATRATELFAQWQADGQQAVHHLRQLLCECLVEPGAEADANGSIQVSCGRGGGLRDQEQEDRLDETVDQSFPASDPPSYNSGSMI